MRSWRRACRHARASFLHLAGKPLGISTATDRVAPAGIRREAGPSFAPDAMHEAYAGPVPGAQSADALHAYASLFDPEAEFDLRLELQLCDDGCVPYQSLSYDSWQAFLDNNPFFVLWRSKTPPLPEN